MVNDSYWDDRGFNPTTREIIVTGCCDCPFLHYEDRCSGWGPCCAFANAEDLKKYLGGGAPTWCTLSWVNGKARVLI